MIVEQFFVEGLGCASYLVGSEPAGAAAVIDPDRDVSRYLDAAARHNLSITHIIETHLHADHVSGNTDLAARTGAPIYLYESAEATFPHQSLQEGEQIMLGDVSLEVRHTPGHTPESITLLVSEKSNASAALTGDTLFIGDVGRPDLVGADTAREMAADLYDSLAEKLLPLPDHLTIYPGHGAGSLCGRSMSSERVSSLGIERQSNLALQAPDKQTFIQRLTTNLPEQPGNFRHIKAINKLGPTPLGEITPHPLTLDEAIPHFERGAALLDTRRKAAYVEKHVPGSIYLQAGDQFSNRIGFVLPPGARIILLLEDEAAYHEVVMSLARVGYEDVVGYLSGGIEEWEAYGLPTASGDVEDITPAQLDELLRAGEVVVIDVREPWEFAQGRVPQAKLIPLGQLGAHAGALDPEQPTALICATGSRSLSAAALLGSRGFRKMYNVVGGTDAWGRQGFPIERG